MWKSLSLLYSFPLLLSQSVPGGTAVVFICYEREKKYLQMETDYVCVCRGTSPDRDVRLTH